MNTASDTALIEVEAVSLDFPLYHTSGRSLKKTLLSTVTRRTGQDDRHRIVVKALRDITLRLGPGDRVGLIGSNGAGKTTLLRTMAGIYEPYDGSVRVRGTLNALLDPNLGMNPNLTGRENIVLRGLYARLDKAGIAQLEADVQEFADMAEFLDLPVRIYSAGMIIRLGFALATAIRPQVLLMDEWFLAGDANFMERARLRLEDMVRGAEILVLSTHNTDALLDWCDRLVWMEQGRIHREGPTMEILEAYLGHKVQRRQERERA
jgi:lipopolysaccharide transport system ATP-binding protein